MTARNFVRQVPVAAILLLCAGFVAFTPANSRAQTEPEYGYGPRKVTLIGTLVERSFPGRPNFESIERGDEIEKQWLLELDGPISVRARADDEVNETVHGLRTLTFYEPQALPRNRRARREWIGKRVKVTGTLFCGNNAHYRTPVAIEVHHTELAVK